MRYWSAVMIPHGTNGFHSMCPFCATPLSAPTPFVRLISRTTWTDAGAATGRQGETPAGDGPTPVAV